MFVALPFALLAALIPLLLILLAPRRWFGLVAALILAPCAYLTVSYYLFPPACVADGCIAVSLMQGGVFDILLLGLIATATRWWAGRGAAPADPTDGPDGAE